MTRLAKHPLLAVAALALLIVACAQQAGPRTTADADLLTVAVARGDLDTFVQAIESSEELTETLRGPGPFTLFAPTDAAFDRLPEGTLDYLLDTNNADQLEALLRYHVLPGAVLRDELETAYSIDTLNGTNLNLSARDGELMINDAIVIEADIPAGNSIVHVIDTVLLPR